MQSRDVELNVYREGVPGLRAAINTKEIKEWVFALIGVYLWK